ncbi:MAG: tetratricopeptide repeat protein [Bacteroidetes bacterium]|nr:tetratricopeptide repeat protein [Bacteroidota bacterium]
MTERLKTRWYLAGILLLVAVVYLPLRNAEFTNWDDQIHVTGNAKVHTLTWESAIAHFRPHTEYMYHPLTMITYAVEWQIGNGSPMVFHLFSLLLHLVNVLLVYRLILRLSSERTIALVVALLFGLHPVNVETVAWISSRKDLLYSLFFLAGLELYGMYRSAPNRWGLYIAVIGVFILGLLSKPTMVVFPAALVLMDWWSRRIWDRNALLEKLPFVLISVGFGIFTMMLSNSDTDVVTIISLYDLRHQVLMVSYAAVFYLGKLLLPVSLSAMYHYPPVVDGMLPAHFYAAPVVLASIVAVLVLVGRRQRYLLLGAALYILPLILVLQVLPFNNTSLVAERYAYISSVAVLFLLVVTVKKLLGRFGSGEPFWRATAVSSLTLLMVLYVGGTAVRVAAWKDSISIFTSVIERDPTVWIAYANRAIDRMKVMQYEEALEDANRAVELHPTRKALNAVRGNVLFFLKRYQEALVDLDSVTFSSKAKPNDFYNKAAVLYYLKQYDSALVYYRTAMDKNPGFAPSHLGYGLILLQERKDAAAAVPHFDSAIVLDRTQWEPYYFRAASFRSLGQPRRALDDISRAIAINPALAADTLTAGIDRSVATLADRIATLNDRIIKGESHAGVSDGLGEAYALIGDSTRSRYYRMKSVKGGTQ